MAKESKDKAGQPQQDGVVVIDALRKGGPAIESLTAYDSTFKVAIVYVYCGYQDYMALKARIYSDHDRRTPRANALCSVGAASPEAGGGNAIVVWVNSDVVPREAMAPSLAHELSHLADHVLETAGVNDSSGEVRAYIIGRETERVFPVFCGLGVPPAPDRGVDMINALIERYRNERSERRNA